MCQTLYLVFACYETNGCESQAKAWINNHTRRCKDFPIVSGACLTEKAEGPVHINIPLKCWHHLLEDITPIRFEWDTTLVMFQPCGEQKIEKVDSETRRYLLEYADSRQACLHHHWLTVVRYFMAAGPEREDDLCIPAESLFAEYKRNMRTATNTWKSGNWQTGTVVGIPEGKFDEMQSPMFRDFFCHWRKHGPDKDQQYPPFMIDFPGYAGDPNWNSIGSHLGKEVTKWSREFKSFEFPDGPEYPLNGAVHRYFAHIDPELSFYRDYGVLVPASWHQEERNRERRYRQRTQVSSEYDCDHLS